MLTAARAHELLAYDSVSGQFYWRVRRGIGIAAGTQAGFFMRHGYRAITVDGKTYLAHRVAWLITFGQWPTSDIDHINREKADNRLCNLRLATRSQNRQNTRVARNNKSGFKGVCWHKQSGKWEATIYVNRRRICLGRFSCRYDAASAYAVAAEKFFGSYSHLAARSTN